MIFDSFIPPKKPKELSGIPLTELFWIDYKIDGITKYVITSDMMRKWYYLYSVDKSGKCTKTKHKSTNPVDLYSHCR